ncbi:putative secreted protein (Por secretion system target) [Kordia periserrulae]|uniref:Putative secreted protein (Por secretion system target) n=1 Tax=Kordia periserrulae TaxID=701523 RepID=A0A2T6BS98_9FLAO|nr:S8 family serine peptidase [Kordia periserrulae]PTX58958.1 putative secreted protein (Por secretion system target) [Kordia periserrulae]
MKNIIIIAALCIFQFATAQTQHAWVYFTDKPNVATALANPTTILTQKAVTRKNNHGVAIDERDVPVNESYIAQVKMQTGITVKAKSKWFNCVHVLGTQTDIDNLLNLSFVSEIFYADRSLNTSSRSSAEANNTRTEEKFETLVMFNYGNSGNQNQMINVHKLHELDYTGEGVTIAVMDSGFPNVNTMTAFQRLRDNGDLLDGYDFVDRTANIYAYTGNSHGTNVLSDMAGYVDGQFVGTAPDASYYLFRTEDVASETPLEESYWVEAAERADSLGVDVVNTSLGYSRFDESRYDYTTADMDGNTTFITKGANIAVEKGILVVNSAGNEGNDGTWGILTAPADGNVFTIGAVNASGNYASFSSRGRTPNVPVKPDVVAQGAGVYVITSGGGIATSNGTSFSSPIMAGAMACMVQAFPNKTNLELMQIVRETGSIYSNPTIQLGHGIPDFEAAFQTLSNDTSLATEKIQIYPNPAKAILTVTLPETIQNTKITIANMLGKTMANYTTNSSFQRVDVSQFSAGMYVLRIEADGEIITKKIIKH